MDTSTMSYPVHVQIQYENDEEYRKSICSLFRQTSDVSLDDDDYDDDAFNELIHFIEEHTRSIPLFQTLYRAAAAHLMSEDAEVGLVVLFSYDCLVHTHRLLCDHFESIGGSAYGTEVANASQETVAGETTKESHRSFGNVVIDISHPSYVVLIHALQDKGDA
jgi:hypothetical protein